MVMGNRHGAHYARHDLWFHVYPHPRRTLYRAQWGMDCCWISKPSRTGSTSYLIHLCVSSISYRFVIHRIYRRSFVLFTSHVNFGGSTPVITSKTTLAGCSLDGNNNGHVLCSDCPIQNQEPRLVTLIVTNFSLNFPTTGYPFKLFL